jgi:hypothetical protein
MSDYEKAVELGLTKIDRWEKGVAHHPISKRLMEFVAKHDLTDKDDYFCWKTGGDGDNGEELMYEMDPFFEMLDKTELKVGKRVIDLDGNRGVVVKIKEGYDIEDHGTIWVWQEDRLEYGADNCEHYCFFGWEKTLKILKDKQ